MVKTANTYDESFPSLLRRIKMESPITAASLRAKYPDASEAWIANMEWSLNCSDLEYAATVRGTMPSSAEGIPTADDYRLAPDDIDWENACMGRHLNESESSKDKRWSPAVYREAQCQNKRGQGDDLCPTCRRRLEKYAAKPGPGPWTGRINEEPEPWLHMLGTTWAKSKKPKWVG